MKTKPTNKYVTFSSVVLMIQLVAAQCLFAQSSGLKDSVVFNFKPGEQSWIVPKGVNEVHISAYGAQGGSATGGKGGLVQSDLTVKPGTRILIYVGSQPTGTDGGYNGGGKGCGNGTGGGGASDIRIDGSALENRVLVAGGGGGMGYWGEGGSGGGLEGGNGLYSDAPQEHVAKGGTQQAGGKAARAYLSEDGKAGSGGNGLDNHGKCSNGAMGGGGGGYYGGGSSGAGGGAGGSSYTSADNKNVIHQQGVNKGNGKVVIYWQQNVNAPY